MSFIFLDQITVIFMQSLYEAFILCDCIIKTNYSNNEYILTSFDQWRTYLHRPPRVTENIGKSLLPLDSSLLL